MLHGHSLEHTLNHVHKVQYTRKQHVSRYQSIMGVHMQAHEQCTHPQSPEVSQIGSSHLHFQVLGWTGV